MRRSHTGPCHADGCNREGEQQLGWHRTLSNIGEQAESFQAAYGWLEFQYLECETLKRQIETATPEERLVLEEQFTVVEAEYLELANKIIANGVRHGFPLKGGGRRWRANPSRLCSPRRRRIWHWSAPSR